MLKKTNSYINNGYNYLSIVVKLIMSGTKWYVGLCKTFKTITYHCISVISMQFF